MRVDTVLRKDSLKIEIDKFMESSIGLLILKSINECSSDSVVFAKTHFNKLLIDSLIKIFNKVFPSDLLKFNYCKHLFLNEVERLILIPINFISRYSFDNTSKLRSSRIRKKNLKKNLFPKNDELLIMGRELRDLENENQDNINLKGIFTSLDIVPNINVISKRINNLLKLHPYIEIDRNHGFYKSNFQKDPLIEVFDWLSTLENIDQLLPNLKNSGSYVQNGIKIVNVSQNCTKYILYFETCIIFASNNIIDIIEKFMMVNLIFKKTFMCKPFKLLYQFLLLLCHVEKEDIPKGRGKVLDDAVKLFEKTEKILFENKII
uniref:Uncharacterized protein n=1 Tax=Strongyloides stercoralis TaxID=6248 RepID=A0AAF5DLB7_STRER